MLPPIEDRVRRTLTLWLNQNVARGTVQPPSEPFAIGTNQGPVRTENQDRVVVARLPKRGHVPPSYLGVLCDGMGGMAGGGQAAGLTVSSIISSTLSSYNTGDAEAVLRHAAFRANTLVFERLNGLGGAVVCAFLWSPGSLTILSVGDARIYGVRRDRTVEQLTVDDTLAGGLRSVGKEVIAGSESNKLLQFVGMGSDMEPHVTRVHSNFGGLLVTSDGAHSVPRGVFEFIVSSAGTPKLMVSRLIEASLWAGGKDNATALAFSFGSGAEQIELNYGDDTHCEVWAPTGTLSLWTDEFANGPQVRKSSDNQYLGVSLGVPRKSADSRPPKSDRSSKTKGVRKRWDKIGIEPILGRTPPPDPIVSFPEAETDKAAILHETRTQADQPTDIDSGDIKKQER